MATQPRPQPLSFSQGCGGQGADLISKAEIGDRHPVFRRLSPGQDMLSHLRSQLQREHLQRLHPGRGSCRSSAFASLSAPGRLLPFQPSLPTPSGHFIGGGSPWRWSRPQASCCLGRSKRHCESEPPTPPDQAGAPLQDASLEDRSAAHLCDSGRSTSRHHADCPPTCLALSPALDAMAGTFRPVTL